MHFGLAKATTIDSVEFLWPSGKTEKIANLAADRFYSVLEGSGLVKAERIRPLAHK
jgi:enediyne biosynthesis protein E4